MKKIIIGILILSLINLSCSAGKVLTAEQQAGYDLINAKFSKLYFKTFSNNLDSNNYDKISELIQNDHTSLMWNLSSPPYKPISIEEIFSEQELNSLKNKAVRSKKVRLNEDLILKGIFLYKVKGPITKINFPIISEDGNYGIVFCQDRDNESMRIFKKEGLDWELFALATVSISDPAITPKFRVPLRVYKTGKLVKS